jgi:GTP:adenosylcobinamide-phosphate guanylyltransferase
MDAFVLAGGVPAPGDPLYALTQGRPKALLPVAGVPLIWRVVGALHDARQINRVCIVGLDPEFARSAPFPVDAVANQGDMVKNALAGIQWLQARNTAPWGVICAGDLPLLTGELVDDVINRASPERHLISYTMVERAAVEAQFPGVKRTYARLRDATVAGGDIHVVQTRLAQSDQALWRLLVAARKQPWRVARTVGWMTLLRFVLRRLSLADAEATAARLLGHPCRIVLQPNAAAAMDIDRPEQIAIFGA